MELRRSLRNSFEDIYKRQYTKDLSHFELTADDKSFIAQLIIDGSCTVKDLVERYNLTGSTLYKYADKLRKGEHFQYIQGTLPRLNGRAREELTQELSKRKAAQSSVGEEEFETLVKESAVQTDLRRGGAGLAVPVSRNYAATVRKTLNVDLLKGQHKTDARIRAEADPRNAVSEAAMLLGFQQNLQPTMIWNVDDYQMQLRNDGEGIERLVIVRDPNDDTPATFHSSAEGDMGFSIKSRVAASPSGALGPMVLIVADANIQPADLIIKIQLPGLCFSASDPTRLGYVVIMKSRVTDIAFNKWYQEKVLIPFIVGIRQQYTPENPFALVTQDGELKNLETIMAPEILALLDTNSILAGKHAASFSAKGNDLDAGNLFKASKKVTKHMRKSEIDARAPEIKRLMMQALQGDQCKAVSWTLEKKKQIVLGICRVVVACQQVMTASLVMGGFETTGRYGPHGFDLDTRLRCSTYPWKAEEIAHVKRQLPGLVPLMREQGYLKESQFDAAGIPSTPDTQKKVKDERPIYQNRACLLNTPENIARHEAMLASREAKKPTAVAARKEAQRALKEMKAAKREDRKWEDQFSAWLLVADALEAEERATERVMAAPVPPVVPQVLPAQRPRKEAKRKAAQALPEESAAESVMFGPAYKPRIRRERT